MLAHHVLFWLKDDVTEDEVNSTNTNICTV